MHKIIYSNVLSLVPAVCTEKCTTLGCTCCKGRDLEDHRGIKDVAQCMWCSPHSQSKHPVPLMILRSQWPKLFIIASLYCLMCNHVGMKQIFIYREIYRYLKPAVKKNKYLSWGRDVDPGLNLDCTWPDCISFTTLCDYWGFLCWLQFILSIN